MVNNFEQAAGQLVELAVLIAGVTSANGGGAPQPSTASYGHAHNPERIDRLAHRLQCYARRRVDLPQLVRAQVIDACTSTPRLARPAFTTIAAVPFPPNVWRKKV